MPPHRRAKPRPVTAPPVMVTAAGPLAEHCRCWRETDSLAVDTEFVRERTFYPALGLIQVSDGRQNVLVDPLAVDDLGPLREVFADDGVVKVFHSCSEDMETLYHHLGEVPWPVFDTQIAAALTGYGYSLGLSALVKTLFGEEIPKEHTRTNWLRRPLSQAQEEYAALDVAYLLPAYDVLRSRLRELGREEWAWEEFEPLRDVGRYDADPRDAFRKYSRLRGLDRRQLAVLRSLAVWREEEARRRDLPRNFVIREAALPALARRRPRSLRDLKDIQELRPEDRNRHGRTLLTRIREALELPREELPEKKKPPLDLAPFKAQVDQMRQAAAETAQDLDLPPEMLATRKTVETLARRAIAGREPVLPPELRGWRREVVGERLLSLAAKLGKGGEL